MIAGPAACALPVVSVRTDLYQQMKENQSLITASVPLRTVDVIGINVHGTFRHVTPGGLSILLTAHFDGVGDDPGLRFPAAADNASSVAVIIEAAQRLHRTLPSNVGLAVALPDAEETGAHGQIERFQDFAKAHLMQAFTGQHQPQQVMSAKICGRSSESCRRQLADRTLPSRSAARRPCCPHRHGDAPTEQSPPQDRLPAAESAVRRVSRSTLVRQRTRTSPIAAWQPRWQASEPCRFAELSRSLGDGLWIE